MICSSTRPLDICKNLFSSLCSSVLPSFFKPPLFGFSYLLFTNAYESKDHSNHYSISQLISTYNETGAIYSIIMAANSALFSISTGMSYWQRESLLFPFLFHTESIVMSKKTGLRHKTLSRQQQTVTLHL